MSGAATLERDALLSDASKASGLTDFGSPDFEPALAVLLESYAKDSRLTPLGRRLVHDELVGDLIGRLQVVDQLKRNPAIRTSRVGRPIFILGLPRTGSTTLQQMLQQDPDTQVLEYWLGVAPQPRPPRETWEANPNYQQVARVLRLTYEKDPGLRALHDVSADGPGECRFVFRHLFMDDSYDHTATLPSYRAWFDGQPMDRVYAWYADVLRLIQQPAPERRWALKYPPHLRCIREIFATFPDACVIHAHRDPARVVPSYASLLANFTAVYEDDVDHFAIARLSLRLWAERMAKGMRDRAELDREDRFFDLQFREVLEDPVGAVERAFRSFGVPLSDEGRARMRAWHQAHPQGRHGQHGHSADHYGLDRKQMSELFREYRERFGVPEERG
jgi:hypothetical protein